MKINLAGVASSPTLTRKDTGFVPSAQQQSIFDAITKPGPSLIIEAVAGSGKTTTLIESVARMKGTVAFTAFNKKIVTEIERKLNAIGIDTGFRGDAAVATFHSLGLRALKGAGLNPRVEGDKVWDILEAGSIIDQKHFPKVSRLVSLAKQFGVDIPDGMQKRPPLRDIAFDLIDHYDLMDGEEGSDDKLINLVIDAAVEALEKSNAAASSVIDFDDMIYLPLLYGHYISRYDWVLLDEAQDTNPIRRMMAERMLEKGGRLIAVGDPHQAIYGFTGANADSLDLIARDFHAERMPLSTTYRCPQAVVRLAHNWVSHIHAAPEAPEGEVSTVGEKEFYDMLAMEDAQETAVLCRNTKPLVSIAYELIRRYIPCHVEGRDIGIGIINMTKKWRDYTLESMRDAVIEYGDTEAAKLESKNKKMKAAAVRDKVETVVVLIDMLPAGSSYRQFEKQVLDLFGDTPEDRKSRGITLSTIHKAKGREWDSVYLYHRDRLMPSQYASKEWEIGQERNLCYVAVTRAKKRLVEIHSEL